MLLILFRIVDPPSFGSFGGVSVDGTVEFGIFLGLIAAAGIAYGGYMAMKEEGTSFGDTADRLSGGSSGGQVPTHRLHLHHLHLLRLHPPPPPPRPPRPHLRHPRPAAASRQVRGDANSRVLPSGRPFARSKQLAGPHPLAMPAATFLANAITVIIGLTPTEVGKREASAT